MENEQQIYIYTEDGARIRVLVISDEVDEEDWRRINLECIETIKPHFLFGTMTPGTQFSAGCSVKHEAMCSWRLYPEIKDEKVTNAVLSLLAG